VRHLLVDGEVLGRGVVDGWGCWFGRGTMDGFDRCSNPNQIDPARPLHAAGSADRATEMERQVARSEAAAGCCSSPLSTANYVIVHQGNVPNDARVSMSERCSNRCIGSFFTYL